MCGWDEIGLAGWSLEMQRLRWFGPRQVKAQFSEPISSLRPILSSCTAALPQRPACAAPAIAAGVHHGMDEHEARREAVATTSSYVYAHLSPLTQDVLSASSLRFMVHVSMLFQLSPVL